MIEIASRGVTLDLNGFEVLGVPLGLDGIAIGFSSLRNIEVRNGSVLGCGQAGVNLLDCDSVRLKDIRVSNNTGDGIIAGPNSVITSCNAWNNGGDGIDVRDGSSVSQCAVMSNGGNGLLLVRAQSSACVHRPQTLAGG